jgi:hypothetical protein
MLSCIIPSYKDPLLNKTIDDILAKAEEEVEIIPVLDGYFQEVLNDPRVHPIHLHKNGGMRNAINTGVRMARGEYIMRTDEHCSFGQGFDRIILETIQDDWIVVPRRYALDVEKWEVMDIPPVDFSKLVILEKHHKFSAEAWPSRDEELKDVMIAETMGMQGSMWVMKKTWWEQVIGELQTEGYGPLYQDSHEMIFKTWQAGGKMMLNKNTWYAHKHRTFKRTHNDGTKENPANKEEGWDYAIKVWGDYYENVVKPKWGI